MVSCNYNEVQDSFHFHTLHNLLCGIYVKRAATEFPVNMTPALWLSKYAKRMLACEINLPTSPSPCPHSYCPTSRHAILCITSTPEKHLCVNLRALHED